MKKIIGNKLYDTEKAEKIYSYFSNRPREVGIIRGTERYVVDVYKTKKGNYFNHLYHDFYYDNQFIEETTLEEIKKIIKEIDPDKYIEMGFDDFEEA